MFCIRSMSITFLFSFFFVNSLLMFESPDLYSRLSINEDNFNHVTIWPLIELAVNESRSNYKLSFVPGEYNLQFSEEEYKANAVVLGENDLY